MLISPDSYAMEKLLPSYNKETIVTAITSDNHKLTRNYLDVVPMKRQMITDHNNKTLT